MDKDIDNEIAYEDEKYNGYLTSSFPIHFLFLSVNKIVKKVAEYKKEEEDYLRQEEEKKCMKAQQKKKRIRKRRLKKLTKKERKLLGL